LFAFISGSIDLFEKTFQVLKYIKPGLLIEFLAQAPLELIILQLFHLAKQLQLFLEVKERLPNKH
jgi:hypothetical protein